MTFPINLLSSAALSPDSSFIMFHVALGSGVVCFVVKLSDLPSDLPSDFVFEVKSLKAISLT